MHIHETQGQLTILHLYS